MSKFDAKTNEEKAIIKAWKDPSFRKKLLNHPKEACKEIGYDLPKDIQIHVFEGKQNTWSFILPPTPANFEQLSENELRKIAAAREELRTGSMDACKSW